jgi:hypothetical protein
MFQRKTLPLQGLRLSQARNRSKEGGLSVDYTVTFRKTELFIANFERTSSPGSIGF